MTQLAANVLTAIVTCNGADTIRDTLITCHAATRHFGAISIIDNASGDATVPIMTDLALPGVQINRLSTNIGVAAAYNLALAQARRKGVRWLLLLDQDTRCQPDCLEILLNEADRFKSHNAPPGFLCPTVINRRFPELTHYPYRWFQGRLQTLVADFEKNLPNRLAVDSTLTSGTLYSVEALTAIHGFCEKYFIDFVDHECHLRLRQKGFDLFWVPRAHILHNLGWRQVMTPHGLWIEHAPYRYYYMMRNMAEGYYRLGGARALTRFGLDALQHCRQILRHGQAPLSTLGYILKGAVHAARGKFGPLDPF